MNTLGDSSIFRMSNSRFVIGTLMVVTGGLLFLDRHLQTGWISLAVLPGAALFIFLWGIYKRHAGLVLLGGSIGGLGVGSLAAFYPYTQPIMLITKIGLLALYSGLGWGIVVVARAAIISKSAWWGMIPAGILGSLGYCLLFTPGHWTDFVLCLSLGIGIPLFIWGMITRLIGLIIPGCLLISIGLGIFLAWQNPGDGNPLVNTGIMLVWFALGWVMITLSGKLIVHRFLWWPLIPGGILAMVGWGLYIGGDPGNALGFIGNTGSIGLMILGLYLLLMRKSIHR